MRTSLLRFQMDTELPHAARRVVPEVGGVRERNGRDKKDGRRKGARVGAGGVERGRILLVNVRSLVLANASTLCAPRGPIIVRRSLSHCVVCVGALW